MQEINLLIGKNSDLSIENKLLIYKAVTKLWGCASKSNKVIMRGSQSKILRGIANTP